MADTHCELCDMMFTAEERLTREVVHSHGGIAFAHPRCKELSQKVFALVLSIEELIDRSIMARKDECVEYELNRMNASDSVKQHLFAVLK